MLKRCCVGFYRGYSFCRWFDSPSRLYRLRVFRSSNVAGIRPFEVASVPKNGGFGWYWIARRLPQKSVVTPV